VNAVFVTGWTQKMYASPLYPAPGGEEVTDVGATVRDATSVDRQRLAEYVTAHVFPDVAGLVVEDFSQASSGYSNDTVLFEMAAGLGLVGRAEPVLEDFYTTGRFDLHTNSCISAVGLDTAQIRQFGDVRTVTVPATAAMLIGPRQPVTDLAAALHGQVADMHVVGDAHAPRNLQAAIGEAHQAARSIG
jgi:hypothetical protein